MYTPEDWNKPQWQEAGSVHEWKNYISDEIKSMWEDFSDTQKQAIARQAENNASNEEWD